MCTAEVREGDLVVDVRAGTGVLTAALRDAGARVLAVELDPGLAAGLRRRFGGDSRVDVVEGDATSVRLPRTPFAVLANLPFSSGTAILRRLLDDPRGPLRRLDAVVEWGLAEKRARLWPSTQLGCYWGAWYELTLVRRVSRDAFAPPPSVDAAVLRAVRREVPLVPLDEAHAYLSLLREGFGRQMPLRRTLPYAVLHRVGSGHGFARDARARDLDARQWSALYSELRSARRRRGGSARARRRPSCR